jgi:hypothetical protein
LGLTDFDDSGFHVHSPMDASQGIPAGGDFMSGFRAKEKPRKLATESQAFGAWLGKDQTAMISVHA